MTNLRNGKSLVVRVNDRGPYAENRIIDVSKRAAQLLDFANRGTTSVRVEYVGPAQLEGSDDRILEATLREGEPAPDPRGVKLAATRIVPVAMTAPGPRTRVASADLCRGGRRRLAGRGWRRRRAQRTRALLIAATFPGEFG